jgi:DNA repair exonuclease SbcCD ATPase subunit
MDAKLFEINLYKLHGSHIHMIGEYKDLWQPTAFKCNYGDTFVAQPKQVLKDICPVCSKKGSSHIQKIVNQKLRICNVPYQIENAKDMTTVVITKNLRTGNDTRTTMKELYFRYKYDDDKIMTGIEEIEKTKESIHTYAIGTSRLIDQLGELLKTLQQDLKECEGSLTKLDGSPSQLAEHYKALEKLYRSDVFVRLSHIKSSLKEVQCEADKLKSSLKEKQVDNDALDVTMKLERLATEIGDIVASIESLEILR